jgi:hypothetical protein
MKLSDIITQAQIISGVQSFQGNAVDANLMRTALQLCHQALSQINNDPQLTLWQETCNYQLADDAQHPDKFPDRAMGGIFSISRGYPLPADCRRVLKAFYSSMELTKTDYSEVARARQVPGWVNMYAVNNDRIELIQATPLIITYAKEFPLFMPGDKVTVPDQALDYFINLTAYNLALALNKESAKACQALALKSYSTLCANLRVNLGDILVNQLETNARFYGYGGLGRGMF